MDFTKNLVLKENYTFLVADSDGQVAGGEHGLYNRDTRFLNRYAWELDEDFQTLLAFSARPDRFEAHYARIEGDAQVVGVHRTLQLSGSGLADRLDVQNSSSESRSLRVRLRLGADFADIFEARGWEQTAREVEVETNARSARYLYHSRDGLELGVIVNVSRAADLADADGVVFDLQLEPGQTVRLEVGVAIANPLDVAISGPSYDAWRAGFDLPPTSEGHRAVLEQAIDDLRALLLFTDQGPIPAAGIPWFVAAFGRDALLTAFMMLPWAPKVAEGTLRFLANYQGHKHDTFRAEAPGKIMHELRHGELTRLGRTPHSPYYGTIDATALFVLLLHESYRHTGDLALVRELRPNWEAALAWMQAEGDLDDDGFLEFQPGEAGKGLAVQSWKDSHDSMSHTDGSLARGALAVSEVQGYAYAAYRAAAEFYGALREPANAVRWQRLAETLRRDFQRAFWLPELGTYAMALDGDKQPLAVRSSDAGQLLWSGIVPEDVAPKLVQTLMSEEMWTGWGIRTLGKSERRYNPVSYHNGSVWPHDTALIAGGMARYGFATEAARVREALFDLAASQPDRRAPELVAGYPRTDGPPVPYPVACRPQAWAAGSIPYLLVCGLGLVPDGLSRRLVIRRP
ncbi:MAG TPA: glycogen debranching N-terminal domain-containing protein, partial [Trueperaceae bacterium]